MSPIAPTSRNGGLGALNRCPGDGSGRRQDVVSRLQDVARTAPGRLQDVARTAPGRRQDGSRTAPGRRFGLQDVARTAPGRLQDGSRTSFRAQNGRPGTKNPAGKSTSWRWFWEGQMERSGARIPAGKSTSWRWFWARNRAPGGPDPRFWARNRASWTATQEAEMTSGTTVWPLLAGRARSGRPGPQNPAGKSTSQRWFWEVQMASLEGQTGGFGLEIEVLEVVLGGPDGQFGAPDHRFWARNRRPGEVFRAGFRHPGEVFRVGFRRPGEVFWHPDFVVRTSLNSWLLLSISSLRGIILSCPLTS